MNEKCSYVHHLHASSERRHKPSKRSMCYACELFARWQFFCPAAGSVQCANSWRVRGEGVRVGGARRCVAGRAVQSGVRRGSEIVKAR